MTYRAFRLSAFFATLFWGLGSMALAAAVPAILNGELRVSGPGNHATIQFEVGTLNKLTVETAGMSDADSMVHVKSASATSLRVGPGEIGQTPVVRLEIATVEAPTFLRMLITTEPGATLTLNIVGLDPITVPAGVTQTYSYVTWTPPAAK